MSDDTLLILSELRRKAENAEGIALSSWKLIRLIDFAELAISFVDAHGNGCNVTDDEYNKRWQALRVASTSLKVKES